MKAMIVAAMLIPAVAAAQVPGAMSFQGRLLKSDGSPETGTPKITFRIYDAGSGGTEKWSEEQDVKLTNGFYAVQLGSVTSFPADLFNGSARWLGVQVAGDSEMVPRQYIATVPYAFKAAKADTAASLSSGGTGIVVNNERIQNVATPTASSDAATKGYVDGASVAAAASVPWSGVTGKPSTFAPSSHQHTGADVTSAVATATALAANGTNCAAGQAALGVDAAGNAEGCWTVPSNDLTYATPSTITWSSGWTPDPAGSRSSPWVAKTSNGIVIARLSATYTGTSSSGAVPLCTLPSGYRPYSKMIVWGTGSASPDPVAFSIDGAFGTPNGGTVYVLGPTSGASYAVELIVY